MSECSVGSGNFTQGRLTQINNYKTQADRFLSSAMDRYSYVLVILIILLILRNSEIMPVSIFYFLFSPILAYLIIDMLYTFYSYKSRGTFNFDNIVWTFNKSSAPTTTPSLSTGGGGVGGYGELSGIKCYNGSCCGEGMIWDSNVGKCVVL
jgi:hypothetical protein